MVRQRQARAAGAQLTPFRQASADTFNAIVSNCSADPKAELTKLSDTFKRELSKQGVLG
jgi:hypothetical protein